QSSSKTNRDRIVRAEELMSSDPSYPHSRSCIIDGEAVLAASSTAPCLNCDNLWSKNRAPGHSAHSMASEFFTDDLGMRTSSDASVHAHGPSLITTHASVIDLVLSMEKVSVRSTLARLPGSNLFIGHLRLTNSTALRIALRDGRGAMR